MSGQGFEHADYTQEDILELIRDLTDNDFQDSHPLWIEYIAEKLLDAGWRKPK